MKSLLNTPVPSSTNKSAAGSKREPLQTIRAGDHVLIVGRSVSMLAGAAREAGFKPLVLDAYGDTDTRAAAEEFRRLYYEGQSIDAVRLRAELEVLERLYGRVPICWGSGWEASGHLLCALASRYPLLGSSPQALLALARPGWSWSAQRGNFAEDDFRLTPTGSSYLVKDRQRAGGHAVRFGSGQTFLSVRQFRQRYLKGSSVSMLCLAGPDGVEVLGWSEHVQLQVNGEFPFRHSAAIARRPLPVEESLGLAIGDAARKLGLWGIFGADLILQEDGSLTIVDINPRPTATVPLHLKLDHAFKLHIDPTQWTSISSRAVTKHSHGTAVVYADIPIRVPKKLNWPAWANDVPSEGRLYASGEPLCSIRAKEGSGEAVRRLLNDRLEELLAMFRTKHY